MPPEAAQTVLYRTSRTAKSSLQIIESEGEQRHCRDEAGFQVFGIETWVFESEQLEDKYN
jgi:hypothetical protein